jgi:HAE1 family hydrophobic/amphiphilic exporter-1
MLASLVFIGWGVSRLDTELLPTFHQGEFTAALKLPIGTPLRSTDAIVRPIEQRVLADTRGLVQRVVTTIGADRDELEQGAGGEHIARLRFDLRLDEGQGGWGARERHVIEAVRTIVGSVPDVELGIERPTLFSFKPPVEIEVRGHELDDLAAVTLEVGARMRSIAALRDVQGSIEPGSPEIRIVYDRDALARYGLDVRSVAQQLADKIGGAEPTRFRWGDRKVPIDVRLADAQRTTLSELRRIVVNPGQAQPIPLAAVAELQLERGPGEIRRVGQQRVGLVTANLSGVGLGRVEGAIEEALGDLELPAGVSVHSAGQSEEWDVSSRSLYFALGLSVFLVYVIMAAQFESLIEPLLILFTIPLAFVGVIGGLLVLDIPLSIVVVLGAIMLTGIVVNNAIVLVDYVDRLRRRGESTERALEIAGQVRLRPILMTTLTTILGLLPMAIGSGDGSELRTPMAIAVIAGLSCSTVLTLIVIPTLYAGVDRLRRGRRVDVDRRLRDELAAVPAEHLRPGVSDEIESHEEPRS